MKESIMNKNLREKVRKIFNKYNPVGAYLDDKTNIYEYDLEIDSIMLKIPNPCDLSKFINIVHEVFQDKFGSDLAGATKNYVKLSMEFYNLLKQDKILK